MPSEERAVEDVLGHMSRGDKILINKVLGALVDVPVVRDSINVLNQATNDPRKPLLLSERLRVATTLLPILKELRDASPRPSTDS